jgi:hypothetical protein
MVKLARRQTGRPGRVTGNQRTGACGCRAPVAGRDPINIYGRTTTASAAVHTVKDGHQPIAARPLLYVPATRFVAYNLAPAMGSGGGWQWRQWRWSIDAKRTGAVRRGSLSEQRGGVRPL